MSIKILSRDFAFYGLLDFLRRSFAILLVPIYTRVLSRSDYGDLDIIFTVASSLAVLIDLQFVSGFSRFYLEKRRSGDAPRFVGTAILTRTTLGAMLAALFLALGFSGLLEMKFMPSFLGNRTSWTFVALAIPVTFAYDVLLAQAQMLQWKKWFFTGAFGNALLSTILCIIFTVYLEFGILGVVLGQFLGTCGSTCLLFVGLRREISFHYHSELLKELARYALPLVPGWWLGFASSYVSRFFIYARYGADENAILAIATKLTGALGLFIVAFRTAWQPIAMGYIGDERGEQFYVRSLRLFSAGGILSVFALTVLSRPILAILAPGSYSVAEYYVPFFLLASVIAELDINLQLGNQISKKTYWMSLASAFAFAINLLILIAFTSRIGIYAAGFGLLLAYVAKVAITYFSARRNYRIPYDHRSLLVFALACLTLLALSLARSGELVDDTLFFSSTAILGIVFSWLVLAGSERRVVRDWTTERVTLMLKTNNS